MDGHVDVVTEQDRPEGASIAGRLAAEPEAGGGDPEAFLDEPLPDAGRLIAAAVALAGHDHGTAGLVDRFWRFAPDEELVDHTPEQMFAAAVAHRALAAQRVPGQLRLDVAAPDAGNGGGNTPRGGTADKPLLGGSA